MAKCYPDSIPAAYAGNDALSDAYRRGWDHGHGVACHNVPSLGAKYLCYSLGRGEVTADNIRDVHEAYCFEAAENARQYSPFEFTASEFNAHADGGWFVLPYGEGPIGPFDTREAAEAEADDGDEVKELPAAEELWEAFEAGTANAIFADLAECTDADYGIDDAPVGWREIDTSVGEE